MADSGAPPKLELVCLGPPAARVDDQVPDGSVIWRKNLALLVYLALADRMTASRGHLVGLLWPEKPEEKARHSLNEAVRRLRAALGAGRLLTSGDQLTLSDQGLEVDAIRFERIVAEDPVAASSIPAGEFLEGLAIDDATTFEQWVAVQRDKYDSLWAGALVTLGESHLAANDLHEAEGAARRALRVLPYHEPAVSILVQTAALSGDVSGAQAVYRDFAERLAEEVGGTVGPGLSELMERVRSRRWEVSRGPVSDDEPPLVGREQVHRTVFEAMGRVRDRGTVVVISGSPGMGKSRLLNECLARAGLAGAFVVMARPLESDQDSGWSTLRSLMRAGLADAPGMAGTPPQALATLAGVIPELEERTTATPAADRGAIVSALAAFLGAVCEEQPLVIALDDSHLADRSTLEVVEAILPLMRTWPMGILMGIGTAVSPPPELLRLHSAVGSTVSGVAVELDPLDDHALRELVKELAPWCKTPDDIDRLTRRLRFEVEGNPQLAGIVLRTLGEQVLKEEEPQAWPRPRATIETPIPFTMPVLIRNAALARMERLEAAAREVLEVASVGGLSIDVDLLSDLLESSVREVETHLDQLEHLGFVRFEEERYVFTEPLTKKAIEECLTRGRHVRICRNAIALLDKRADAASVLARIEYLVKTSDAAEAFAPAMEIARTAMEDGAFGTARRALAVADQAAGFDTVKLEAVTGVRAELALRPPPEPVQP